MVLLGSLMIGGSLLAGQWFYPDQVWMWFATADGPMLAWRVVIVAGLLALALLREYFDNVWLRATWGVAGAALLWAGTDYFINRTDLMFDAMLMTTAGISFAVAALQPAPEPIEVPRLVEALLPSAMLAYYARLRSERQLERLDQVAYLSDARDNSHRLIIRWPLVHT